jgi:hypothetical protein
MNGYESALATQEWLKVAPYFNENASVTFSNGTYVGLNAIREAFEENFTLIREEAYAISNLQWPLRSEFVAVCIYHFSWQGLVNNSPASGGGRGTTVLANLQGTWAIVSEHLGPHAS